MRHTSYCQAAQVSTPSRLSVPGSFGQARRMRIGAAFEPTAAAYYRGVYPLEAMMRKGHEIVWPELDSGDPKLSELGGCDVVYVFRRSEEPLRRALAKLAARGVGIVWDTDDDLSAIPRRAPNYKSAGGIRGHRRFAETLHMARLAHVMLASTETIRAKYETAGVGEAQVFENYLPPKIKRKGIRHDGLIVGWIAGMEHTEDAIELGLGETLQRVLARHPDLRVESVGVDLGLPDRYVRHATAHFSTLPDHMARYDIGLAPIVDVPFNAARSNIKVKEYAASSVPWLASARGAYAALGESEGGVLVPDDGWEAALDALIVDQRRRKKLAKAGKAWAKTQTIDRQAGRFEGILREAAARAGVARAA
jgi:glycosyltransferase involved in cell wall biosynthesis